MYLAKFRFLVLLLILVLLLPDTLYSQNYGQWVWMKGSDLPNPPSIYGVQGVASPANNPPGLSGVYKWADTTRGKFWIFGGVDYLNRMYSDLWCFDLATLNWTWVKGPGIPDQLSVFGTQGQPSPVNNPSARTAGMSWIDQNGDLYLFGGYGYYATGYGQLGDLWKFNVTSNEWTWLKGSLTSNYLGNYGTINVSSPSNEPPSTCCAVTWVSNSNELYMFGGIGGLKNTVWKYTPATNEWIWLHGTSAINSVPPVYGTKNVASPANTPGGRWNNISWTDKQGNFWLFGGSDYWNFATRDMWMYNPAANMWTWMAGDQVQDSLVNVDLKCITDTITPSTRAESNGCWVDACGNFWLYGGFYFDIYPLNDMWMFNPNTQKFTYTGGYTINQLGNYGNIQQASPSNYPHGMSGGGGMRDKQGRLWMFMGIHSFTNPLYFNSVWVYTPDPYCTGGYAVNAGEDQSLCLPVTQVELTASTTLSGMWSQLSGPVGVTINSPGDLNTTASGFSTPGTYTFLWTSFDQTCEGVYDTVRIIIADGLAEIILPNVFTPNGDGTNDYYDQGDIVTEEFEMRIFDRWGRLLFTSINPEVNWDGKFDGNECNEGVYFATLRVTNCKQEKQEYRTFFHLER
ncbi:MAG: gliding motility-associated C-terminal domain-containing protein [Bacteroidetes bacterium]|nr:gliding motility-associated C-terminal domain-containing protein [Bacteroidota bacterium]